MLTMKAVENGDLSVKADIRTGDELQRLAESFNVMTTQLEEHIRQRGEQERMKQELELARRIQTAILPKHMRHDDFEIEAIMLPAEEVGGDYYDVLYGRDGSLWLAIGDVSGHGMTPGLIMIMAQTIHTTITTQTDYTPKQVVEMVNRVLYHNVQKRLGADHFMTFTTLKYAGDGRFIHAGCHLDMIVYRQASGTCELIDTKGVFLNFIEEIGYATEEQEFQMERGDILVLYTDGVTEAHSPITRDLFDVPRLRDSVTRHAALPTAAMRDAIINDAFAWCEQKQDDDMTLLIARRV